MAALAILIGIYSYLIFALGLLGLLERKFIVILTGSFLLLIAVIKGKKVFRRISRIRIKEVITDKISLIFLTLLLLQVFVNLVGALGPELGFDALWYHLTLPKLYLQEHRLFFVPGSLLYYCSMPKLLEMVYTVALAFQGEILAKIIHFILGICCCLAIFRLARRYFTQRTAWLVTICFYSSLVVGWQSITAYVDLGRTFFEILALDYFLRWWKSQKNQDLIESAVMLGLAATTKMLAFGSLVVYLPLIIWKFRQNFKRLFLFCFCFSFLVFLIPLPWLIFSFIHTRNPFYPLFADILDQAHTLVVFRPPSFLTDFWNLFLHSADPINPLFLIVLPCLVVFGKKLKKVEKVVLVYCLLSYSAWYFTPRTGGGRFFLPYLPAFCFLVGSVYELTRKSLTGKFLLTMAVLLSLVNLVYRAAANAKYLPVIFHQQSKEEFLLENLNFAFGDFYDSGGKIKDLLKPGDLVLIKGIHNLYYVDFPFEEESWAKNSDVFTHLLFRGEKLPKIFGQRRLVYENKATGDKLYLFPNKWHESY